MIPPPAGEVKVSLYFSLCFSTIALALSLSLSLSLSIFPRTQTSLGCLTRLSLLSLKPSLNSISVSASFRNSRKLGSPAESAARRGSGIDLMKFGGLLLLLLLLW